MTALLEIDDIAKSYTIWLKESLRSRSSIRLLGSGVVVGEIGIFASNQVRTATVVCRSDCKLLELTEQKAREMYFEDYPAAHAEQ